MRRVAVTGIGLATGLGVGTGETWRGLVEGRSAVRRIAGYDPSALRTQIAAEIDELEPERFASRKTLRSTTRNDQLAIAGAALAVEDAGGPDDADGARKGLFIGSSKDASKLEPVLEAVLVARTEEGSVDVARFGAEASSALNPLFYIEGLQAAALFYISEAHGLKGANAYFAGTAEAGAVAIGRAYGAVRRGEVDWALAGGFDDAASWWNMTKLDTIGILTGRNDLGAGACRPYDADRDGTVAGEGAAFLVLEALDEAERRGARVYAEVTGFGSAYDAYRLITPDPNGTALARAIEAALHEDGDGAVDYVATHGSGTRAGDASEARALRRALGAAADTVAASSVKPAAGHLMGGAGALNAAVAALALHHRTVPPTLNLSRPDPACGLDWVPGEAREIDIDRALALARGLEGQNVALALRAVR